MFITITSSYRCLVHATRLKKIGHSQCGVAELMSAVYSDVSKDWLLDNICANPES